MEPEELARRAELLRQEHRDLDRVIEAWRDQPSLDQLQLARLKKRKLRLRDEIAAGGGSVGARHHRVRRASPHASIQEDAIWPT